MYILDAKLFTLHLLTCRVNTSGHNICSVYVISACSVVSPSVANHCLIVQGASDKPVAEKRRYVHNGWRFARKISGFL